MSFAALLRGAPTAVPGALRSSKKQHKYEARTIEASIENGERVVAFIQSTYGHEQASVMLEDVARRARGSQPSGTGDADIIDVDGDPVEDSQSVDPISSLPYGFWRRFFTDDLQIQFTSRKRMQYSRALKLYMLRKSEGADTMAAMRGTRDRGSFRGSGGFLNARKAAGLGFALLQFFVDHVQRLMCRADSDMMMKKARELRADLLHGGWKEQDLPNLDGNAGAQWFMRWRERYGIVRKVVGMKLQVPWVKVKRRIRVLLGNIFRLRALWELCHPGIPMRFISADQKPSYYNNAGHTGTFAKKGGSQPRVRENFAKTRERYSILTSVPSFGHGNPDVPPKVAILFKAKPNGLIIRKLKESTRLKPWMHVQVQESGSYRSADMVEALDWMLPQAHESKDSIVVLLDWAGCHLTEEVFSLVRLKGHVLLHHGGGSTPFTQINDTHLHALVARLLIQVENDWALKERERLLDLGQNKTPELSREEILSIVQTAWLSIDHARVAEKGYKQTGPTMPLTGTVAPEDVFKDLLRAMEEMDPSSNPLEVGMASRDKDVAFVREGWDAGKWTQWSDCHKLIQDQDGLEEALEYEEALEEGLEGVEDCVDDEDSEPTDDSGDENDGGDGGDGNDGGGPDRLSAKPDGHVANHDAFGEGDAEGTGGPSGVNGGINPGSYEIAAGSGASGDQPMRLASARELLYKEAMRTKDDVMLRHVRKRMREETQNQRDAATKVSVLLLERAKGQRDAESRRRKEALEEERLAAKDLEESKVLRAKAEQATAEARLESLRLTIVNRRDAQARKRQEIVDRAFQRWLQTQYPAMVARRCMVYWRGFSKQAQTAFQREIANLMKGPTFRRQVFIPDLWSSDRSFTLDWARVKPFTGGADRYVRCSLCFQEVVDEVLPREHFGRFPVETLYALFSAFLPHAQHVFVGAYSPLRLLHVNDYVLEKAFVYGIIALSKWLGEERFPPGVFGQWPPQVPAGLAAQWVSANSSNIDEAASTGSPLGLGHLDDAHIPPHLRFGSVAASSASACPP